MTETIVTGHIARLFVGKAKKFLRDPETTVAHWDSYKAGKNEVHLMLRHCWRRHGGGQERTGGLVFELRTQSYKHDPAYNSTYARFNKRLGPGWTVEKLQKQLSLGIGELKKDEFLRNARETLYVRVKKLDWDHTTMERFIEDNPDRETDYKKMTGDDIMAWNRILTGEECYQDELTLRERDERARYEEGDL